MAIQGHSRSTASMKLIGGTTYSDIIISVLYTWTLQRFSNRKKQIYTGALNSGKFPGVPDYAHGYFSKKILGFCSDSIPSERALVSSFRPPYILFLYHHSFARHFRLQLSVGGCKQKFGGRGAVGGRGWYRSKERCWVFIGRP